MAKGSNTMKVFKAIGLVALLVAMTVSFVRVMGMLMGVDDPHAVPWYFILFLATYIWSAIVWNLLWEEL